MAVLRLLLNRIPSIATAIEQVPLVDCTADHFLLLPYAAEHASVAASMLIAVTFVGFS